MCELLSREVCPGLEGWESGGIDRIGALLCSQPPMVFVCCCSRTGILVLEEEGSVRGMGQAIRFCGLCACQSQLRTCISVQRCLRDQAVFLVETQTQGLYHNAVPCDWGVWRLLCAYSHGVYFVALSAGCFTLAFQQLLEGFPAAAGGCRRRSIYHTSFQP